MAERKVRTMRKRMNGKKAARIARRRYMLEFKGTVQLGRAMKLNKQALDDGLMDIGAYLQTRENYSREFQSLLDQEMPVPV